MSRGAARASGEPQVNNGSSTQGPLQRALAGDGAALAAIRGRLQDGLARVAGDPVSSGEDRQALLRGAYAAALDLLPRLMSNKRREDRA